MKKKIPLLVTAGMIVTPVFLTSIIPLPGISIQAYANTTETFDKVEKDIVDKSKEVIKKETEAWKKDLKSDVKATIESICKESDFKTITKINTELRQGDEAKSKDTIEKLDAALRAAPVTKEVTKVYIDGSLKNDFGVSKENVKTGETVITENGYITGSLVRNTSASTSEVIELTIPKGEHMANMTPSGSSILSYNELLERGHSFIITAKKEIKDMGKTRTKIEAELLPKDFVKENKRETEVPTQFKLEDPFIQLDIQGKDTEVAYQEAQNIANRIGKIDPVLLNTLKEKGAMLTLVDYPITDVAGFEHLKNVVPPGWEGATDAAGNQLTWNDVPSLQNRELKLAVVRIGYSEKGKGHSSINLELNTIAKLLDREVLGSPSTYSHAFASIHAAE
ncbi:TPA: hypothetical protein ROY17_005900, partial [Bacillus thuringiensis]|nr:hypothetical protein [Bacillus thuringiensis]